MNNKKNKVRFFVFCFVGIIFLNVLFLNNNVHATSTIFDDNISITADTTWNSENSPYLVRGKVYVSNGLKFYSKS